MVRTRTRLSSGRRVGKLHHDVLQALDKALEAANPKTIISNHVKLVENSLNIGRLHYPLKQFRRIFVIGAGKASGAMAEQVEKILGRRILKGLVIVPDYLEPRPIGNRIEYRTGSHPTPSMQNFRAAARMLSIVRGVSKGDLVISLLSGGASSLMEYPLRGIGVGEEKELTSLLLKSGANIRQINTVRRHISQVKGGRLALLLAPATVLTLIISDVIGNDISAVGSGPTAPDPTTYRDAKEVVDGYDLRSKIPARIRKVIDEGVRGQIPDTPKAGDAVFRKVRNIVIGNNLLSCKAAAVHMDNLGYESRVLTTHMVGESRDLGGFLGSILTDIRVNGLPIPSPVALTVGGETTVTIRGNGKGGRNQELVLASAPAIDGLRNVVLVSLATDGVDGPTDAAGAIADGTTVTRGFKARMKAEEYLGNNDSYSYFRRLGDLVRTGPTGTNVNDLTIVAAR